MTYNKVVNVYVDKTLRRNSIEPNHLAAADIMKLVKDGGGISVKEGFQLRQELDEYLYL